MTSRWLTPEAIAAHQARYGRKSARSEARAADWEYATTDPTPSAPASGLPSRPAHDAHASAQLGTYPVVSLCRAMRIPEPVPEYEFALIIGRKWRFDYAWPLHKLALEVEGGIWTQGRHTRGAGALADLAKYSEAAILGWRVIYCTPDDVASVGMDRVERALR